jgi:hypothetical protein
MMQSGEKAVTLHFTLRMPRFCCSKPISVSTMSATRLPKSLQTNRQLLSLAVAHARVGGTSDAGSPRRAITDTLHSGRDLTAPRMNAQSCPPRKKQWPTVTCWKSALTVACFPCELCSSKVKVKLSLYLTN